MNIISKVFIQKTGLLMLFFLCFTVSARWAEINEINNITEYDKVDVHVDSKGRAFVVIEIHYKVNKDAGRAFFTPYVLDYNEYVHEMKIIEAKVITKGKTYKVNSSKIEDKPLASPPLGFDQKRQAKIPFTNVEEGSTVVIKYSFKDKVPFVENNYIKFFSFDDYTKKLDLSITSDLPLQIQVSDPTQALEVKKENESDLGFYKSIQIKSIKDINSVTKNELQWSRLNPAKLTWVGVTSFKDWEEFGDYYVSGYFAKTKEKLPKLFDQILQEAKTKKTYKEQIDHVTSSLSSKVQYFGHWTTIQGMYFPRSLEEIARSQIGDCKDYSVVTAAILKRLGYKVSFVLVARGTKNFFIDTQVPFDLINHVFLKVVDRGGKVYWLDPTNQNSMAGYIFSDISSKPCVVFGEDGSYYEKTPALRPEDSVVKIQEIIRFENDNTTEHEVNLLLENQRANRFTGWELNSSKKRLCEILFKERSKRTLEDHEKLVCDVPDLKSRIVKPINIRLRYRTSKRAIQSSYGSGLINTLYNVYLFASSKEDFVRDIINGPPFKTIDEKIFKNVKIPSIEKFYFKTSTPWIDIDQEAFYQGDDTVIRARFVVKTKYIPVEVFKDKQFLQLKEDFRRKVTNVFFLANPEK